MPDKVVTLEFEGKGIVELTQDVKDLAAAVGSLPSKVPLRANATGSGVPPALPPSAAAAQSAYMAQQQTFGSSGPSKAAAQANKSAQSIKINVAAMAQATAQGNMSLTSLASTISKLHPAAAIAVGTLTAVAAALDSFVQRGLAAGASNMMYGPSGGSAARGMSGTLGGDQAAAAEKMQSAMDSDSRAQMYAQWAGINPFGDPYGGDPDLPKKLKQAYAYYGDPSKVDQMMAADAARHMGLDPDTLAKLRALDKAHREQAINTMDNVSDAWVKRAAELQAGWDRMKSQMAAIPEYMFDSAAGGDPGKRVQGQAVHYGPHGEAFVGPQSADKIDRAADTMDRAAEKMGVAAEKFSVGGYGINGGGQRSHHPFPPGWGHIQFQEAQLKAAAPLGVTK